MRIITSLALVMGPLAHMQILPFLLCGVSMVFFIADYTVSSMFYYENLHIVDPLCRINYLKQTLLSKILILVNYRPRFQIFQGTVHEN